MRLVEANNSTCHLCLQEKIDPEREDNLCAGCGIIVDKYGGTADVVDQNDYLVEDDDCGC